MPTASDLSTNHNLAENRALVVWFTGLSGAGKTTLANQLKTRLALLEQHAFVLDGDKLREGINAGLGFSEEDRKENIRRTAEIARLFSEAGTMALVALISPFAEAREMAKNIIGDAYFLEVFVNCPLPVAQERDTKGLYKKAAAGELRNFTGIDSAYEIPESPDLELRTDLLSPEQCLEQLLITIRQKLNLPS